MSGETLQAYFDGELGPEERRAVEQMLEADPSLAERLAALEGTDRLLEMLPAHRGDAAGFVARLAGELRLERALELLPAHPDPAAFGERVLRAARRERRRGLLVRIAAPLAAAAAVLAAVVLLAPAPAPRDEPSNGPADYAWETDLETFGSLAVTDQEADILEELQAT